MLQFSRRIKVMVIDEADTLLDDSFFNDTIMDAFEAIKLNDKKCAFASQLVLVSATIPSDFKETLEDVVDIDSIERITTPQIHRVMPHVKQIFMRIHGRERSDKLLELARDNMKNKRPTTIIFVNRTFACDYLHDHLNDHEISCNQKGLKI
ncbi:putative ATP-dependent RNA helicase DDX28-like protein [Leptotrombidium deliense]|uniref:Putative ATP-dependent RNA helicase DDX28-like protein n=1 Tax=Leptotrombidium deliense TaxID=299467 RepID=A0A443RMU7_9ACAR|nr:putative ATP-dependent RNA helicase DDX28-like protein [Leptotrombidium deliense]